MKTIFVLIAIGILLFGCTGSTPEKASATPTNAAKAAPTIDAALEAATSDSAAQAKELNDLSQQIDQAGTGITNEDLNALK
ncbi:hypothetical protein HY989_04425 [Candidatus Micrarchaeota archaeon]|nr:hypothetical protein [Candidatus Micrarchaeota archaeon]